MKESVVGEVTDVVEGSVGKECSVVATAPSRGSEADELSANSIIP